MTNTRVVLIDDHPTVRAGLRSAIENERGFSVVGESSGADASEIVARANPDLILLDLGLGDVSGLDVLPKVHSAAPRARIVILSMHVRADYLQRALTSGAAGYLSKESSPELVVAALRTVANGGAAFDDATVSILRERLEREAPRSVGARSGSRYAELTAREQEVFRLLAEGHSTKEAARLLGLAHRTVENYQTGIYQKLGLGSSAELVRLAIELGVV